MLSAEYTFKTEVEVIIYPLVYAKPIVFFYYEKS